METGSTGVASVSRRGMGRFRVLALALVLFGGGVGASTFGPMLMREIGVMPAAAQNAGTPVATDEAAANPCFTDSDGVQAELWVRTEMYFGTSKADGTAYSNEEWMQFLADVVTPRFPDGLTVLTGIGQWRDSESSQVVQERSNVLIILHPFSNYQESSVKLEEVRDAYEQQFNQSSVLRTEDSVGVCTSF